MTNGRWRQLEELYDAVVNLSPAERSLRLQDVDPELRSALEAILAQEGSALEHPAWEDRASLLETGTVGLETGTPIKPDRSWDPTRSNAKSVLGEWEKSTGLPIHV